MAARKTTASTTANIAKDAGVLGGRGDVSASSALSSTSASTAPARSRKAGVYEPLGISMTIGSEAPSRVKVLQQTLADLRRLHADERVGGGIEAGGLLEHLDGDVDLGDLEARLLQGALARVEQEVAQAA